MSEFDVDEMHYLEGISNSGIDLFMGNITIDEFVEKYDISDYKNEIEQWENAVSFLEQEDLLRTIAVHVYGNYTHMLYNNKENKQKIRQILRNMDKTTSKFIQTGFTVQMIKDRIPDIIDFIENTSSDQNCDKILNVFEKAVKPVMMSRLQKLLALERQLKGKVDPQIVRNILELSE